MKKLKAWYDDEEFWTSMMMVWFQKNRLMETPAEVDQIVRLMGVKRRACVLDFGCGLGRHALELARRGYQVTGVDRTKTYLSMAKGYAEREGLKVEWALQDMRKFRRPNAYDGAINLFTTFGYFENQADDKKVLVNVHRSLKKGGVFVIDTLGKEALARNFQERTWSEHDGVIALEERRVSKDWGWLESQWTLVKGKVRRTFNINIRIYSAVELTTLLKESGFRSVSVYGHLTGDPYDHTAKRLVAVAQK